MVFDTDRASPGDEVHLVVQVRGDESPAAARRSAVSGTAEIRWAEGKTDTVTLVRTGSGGEFIGRVRIPESISGGVATAESIELGAYSGSTLKVSRQSQPEFFETASVLVE
jgi:hypothetical protein